MYLNIRHDTKIAVISDVRKYSVGTAPDQAIKPNVKFVKVLRY